MRTYEAVLHELIGQPAREILDLAERYGRPNSFCGLPLEVPVPFELPDLRKLVHQPDVFIAVERLEGVIGVLYGAVDYHWIRHKKIFVMTRPFEPMPVWATPEGRLEPDPNWQRFQHEALQVVQRFVDELANRGLVRYVAREPGSLTV